MRSGTQTKLIGTRCRFQRISDSKFFGGWIEDFHDRMLLVRGDFGGTMTLGDRFLFHLCAEHAATTFIGQFTVIHNHAQMRSVAFNAAPTRRARVLEIPEACYKFEVLTDLHYRKPKGGVRKAICAINAFLTADSQESEILLTDVSVGGVGLIGMDRFCEGEEVALRFEIPGRTVNLDGQVRYSLPITGVADAFRTGLKFNAMDRVHGALWGQFLQTVSSLPTIGKAA